jgi:hypothetical protein
VTIVAFLRNIVGVVPFGTFLPALIAVSFRDTGLFWGMGMFVTIITTGVLFNELLRHAHILHFPRLGIVLIAVVALVIGLSVLALQHGFVRAANVGMFPLAILTLTIERFSIIRDRANLAEALRRLGVSLVVAALCYGAMMNFHVRSALLVFPELLLIAVGLNILIGTYTGLRLSELLRFRHLNGEKAG